MKPRRFAIALCLLLSACGEEKKPYQAPVPKTPASPVFQNEQQILDNPARENGMTAQKQQ